MKGINGKKLGNQIGSYLRSFPLYNSKDSIDYNYNLVCILDRDLQLGEGYCRLHFLGPY